MRFTIYLRHDGDWTSITIKAENGGYKQTGFMTGQDRIAKLDLADFIIRQAEQDPQPGEN